MNFLQMAILGLTTWQGMVTVSMEIEKRRKYQEAEAYAQAAGKPLLVVGGPFGSAFTGRLLQFKAHGCGDMCLDLDAQACQGCPTTVGDIREIPFPDLYFGAAYVSHVLEHMLTLEDAVQAIDELSRVAEDIWIMVPPKASIRGWLHADHHLWLTTVPEGIIIEEREGQRRTGLYQRRTYGQAEYRQAVSI